MTNPQASSVKAFTLVESMVTIAIVAILAAIAIPNYNDFIRRGHRANARTTLLQAAHWLERAATATGTYPQASDIPAGILQLEGSRVGAAHREAGVLTVPGDRYTLTANSQNGQTYSLVATPTANTAQSGDPCGALAIDQAGRRSVRQAQVSVESCWSR